MFCKVKAQNYKNYFLEGSYENCKNEREQIVHGGNGGNDAGVWIGSGRL
ncbi:hypothetical protein FACS1894190_04240 [Spirochaetia bacterium]|nr:hypothetical protein FACS1894190_04240 [Spirochaetia bacterium]